MNTFKFKELANLNLSGFIPFYRDQVISKGQVYERFYLATLSAEGFYVEVVALLHNVEAQCASGRTDTNKYQLLGEIR